MRTHRLVIDCNCKEYADYMENEILHVDFCDLTHWYCGLDDAGEDTPDICVIYRGVYNPNRIYVEVDLKKSGMTEKDLQIYQRFEGPYVFHDSTGNIHANSGFIEKYPNCDSWKAESVKIEHIV